MEIPAYAHTIGGLPSAHWERLELHLAGVSERAARLAAAFSSADWGRVAGLWHDLGKYRPEFQAYLRGDITTGGEHAGLGAALAIEHRGPGAWPLAFAIAGHHAGLANRASNAPAEVEGLTGLPIPLADRLRANAPTLRDLRSALPHGILGEPLPPLPSILLGLTSPPKDRAVKDAAARTLAFWTRMLFSALVDADRLETARFYAQHTPALLYDDLRANDIPTLRDCLDAHLDALAAGTKPMPVNALRAEILRACRERAALLPGRFSLTVPTGGGKTLAAMSFALNHAHPRDPGAGPPRHRRVIVVIPFTSIIEQNAAVYRRVLGDANVLEHHSNLDEATLTERDPDREARRQLAAENWDAPVVVTTTVQFFESLFSNHPSRCRKLHNIARSVIVLDEVQTLPPQLLAPILDALAELTDRYGCTVVLSTATPPALARGDTQPHGLSGVTEIIPDPAALSRRARRVRVRWEIDEATPYAALAERLA